jgi:hypothetical protein
MPETLQESIEKGILAVRYHMQKRNRINRTNIPYAPRGMLNIPYAPMAMLNDAQITPVRRSQDTAEGSAYTQPPTPCADMLQIAL